MKADIYQDGFEFVCATSGRRFGRSENAIVHSYVDHQKGTIRG